jgi:hypothetical protein
MVAIASGGGFVNRFVVGAESYSAAFAELRTSPIVLVVAGRHAYPGTKDGLVQMGAKSEALVTFSVPEHHSDSIADWLGQITPGID